jgi:mono/diheme cytochrome c family protein
MRAVLTACLFAAMAAAAGAHNFGVATTWNREISRLVFARCASCHREGGTSFSLMTYQDIQPRAVAIKEAVLARRMPPWGAVKGFGSFRNDQGLTQEQIELVTRWVDDGAPRGNNARLLPQAPRFDAPPPVMIPKDAILVTGERVLKEPLALDGLQPERVPTAPMQVVAALPDGSIQPLLWLYQYQEQHGHPFLFRQVVRLPAGTVIRGVPPGSKVTLIPAAK